MSLELSQAARQCKNEYARQWRARNRDKTRQYNERYWEARAQVDNATQNKPVKTG